MIATTPRKQQPLLTWILTALAIGASCLAACQSQAPPPALIGSPAPTNIPTATALPTETRGPTATLAPSLTPTDTPTDTPTHTPTPTPTPTKTPIPRLVATPNPAGQVGLGVYMDGVPYDEFRSTYGFERTIQHKMQYVLWFHAWGDSDRTFPAQSVWLAWQMGYTPVLTWEPWKRNFDDPTALQPEYTLASIADGQHDAYIRSWTRAARASGVPIILRFAHEQSTEPGTRPWYPWQGDPEGYRAAFRHIAAVFEEEGADNVQFLWSAMWLNGWASQYYPGDDVVDWVGTTVLNHGTGATAEWAEWRTFYDLFDGQHQAAYQWNKPIMLTELATAEYGGDKAVWIEDCYYSLQYKYTLVRAVLLFEVESDREWPIINWSVASSPESLAAFQEAISDPYFK